MRIVGRQLATNLARNGSAPGALQSGALFLLTLSKSVHRTSTARRFLVPGVRLVQRSFFFIFVPYVFVQRDTRRCLVDMYSSSVLVAPVSTICF